MVSFWRRLLRVFTRLSKKQEADKKVKMENNKEKSKAVKKEQDDDKIGVMASLPLQKNKSSNATIDIHYLPTDDGIIVKVMPPDDWEADGTAAATSATPGAAGVHPPHVPCDIVLVIDVSGSMSMDAPVPAAEGETSEDTGLSVLDLVKHASRTILETLNENDRLAIVTFATGVKVVQELISMTPANKKTTESNIARMQPEDSTNLWQGVVTGMKQFEGKTSSGRVPSIMVLTDGLPNFLSPAQGYIPKMRTLAPSPAPIHTFGFGYHLRSGLLKSISEFTGGNYSFIPDAGMIGTVFVHAVANMQTTFATEAVVHLTMPREVTIKETLGDAVKKPHKTLFPHKNKVLTVNVGALQYGQSRDIYLTYATARDSGSDLSIKAKLEYKRMTDGEASAEATCPLPNRGIKMEVDSTWDVIDEASDCPPPYPLSTGEMDFHISRSMLCSFIAKYFPLDGAEEHNPILYNPDTPKHVDAFIKTLPAGKLENANDPMCKALMADVSGQVTLALADPDSYQRWGRHYLPSLQGAHTVQQCNSFKDPGALLYAATSPRFIACRNALDTAFDTLPPPTPSNLHHRSRGRSTRHGGVVYNVRRSSSASRMATFSMSSYRNSSGPCFASFCRVNMANGKVIRVNRLRKGMQVQTPRGPRAVSRVLKTPVSSIPMVTIGRLLITAWHPVSHNGADWVFPCKDKARRDTPVRYTGSIYSILLEEDEDVDAHAMNIEGLWVVTLGHGLTEKQDAPNPDDVRIHSFLGDYAAVSRSLDTLDVRKDGLVINGGSTRGNYRKWHTRK
ncbi:u-box domain containing protein [Ophiostoma piceae UAMH 11346]|uniref:U-box domain containing protein n=1 Tax=Ophiostoma piceae (strain UAMH 11346) TaxID=1262450 RepID=S3CBE6_OPHP1|nr:u-box domain containing protein [Ophiostoma piceae UAMH 11346]